MCSVSSRPRQLPHNRRMRRADRLFRIVQLLRRRRTVVTAAQIAGKLEISERTVYRDIRDLIQAGTPIDGEAGVGYRLRPGYDLPPLMFDRDEIQALVLGARIVAQFGDPALARASESILSKVAGVLPKELEPLLADTRLFVPATRSAAKSAAGLAVAREALVARRRIHLTYASERGEETERDVRPLGVFFWGRTWTLAAWCELREGFRNFRLDRIGQATLRDRFEEEPGRTLRDMLAQYGPAAVRLLD
jgi:predicted DNA-binding transcriptional regulator YafY